MRICPDESKRTKQFANFRAFDIDDLPLSGRRYVTIIDCRKFAAVISLARKLAPRICAHHISRRKNRPNLHIIRRNDVFFDTRVNKHSANPQCY